MFQRSQKADVSVFHVWCWGILPWNCEICASQTTAEICTQSKGRGRREVRNTLICFDQNVFRSMRHLTMRPDFLKRRLNIRLKNNMFIDNAVVSSHLGAQATTTTATTTPSIFNCTCVTLFVVNLRLRRKISWCDVLKRTWAYNHEFSFLFFWTWIKSLTIQLQHPRKIAYIWQIKRVQNNAIKFERTQIHFLAPFSLPSLSSLSIGAVVVA